MSKEETAVEREPLDIDAWIDGAERPEAEVTLTGKGKALAALTSLRKKRAKALRDQRVETGRMVQNAATEYDDDIAELEAEVKASEMTFLLRGVDGETHAEMRREHSKDMAAMVNALVAAAVVTPPMTVEKVARMRKAVGEGQFGILVQTANSLSFDAEPDLPF